MRTVEINFNNSKINLCFNSRYAVVNDESGTGKTRLASTVLAYSRATEGLTSFDGVKAFAATHEGVSVNIDFGNKDAVLVIDEGYLPSARQDLLNKAKSGKISVVFISRSKNASIPYGLHDRFRLSYDGKICSMVEDTDPFNHSMVNLNSRIIIHEDDKFGFSVMKHVFGKYGYTVVTAKGKDNIRRKLREFKPWSSIIVNADMCGIDGSISLLLNEINTRKYGDVRFIDRPSVESALLDAPCFRNMKPTVSSQIFDYESVEVMYLKLLNNMVSNRFEKEYNKSDDSELLQKLFHDGDDWFYPEIPR